MYCGMSFIIHDKESYTAHKEEIKEILMNHNLQNDVICNAATIEFKGNLFLIIDGYSSLLDWTEPEEELKTLKEIFEETCEDLLDEACEDLDTEKLTFVDTRFLHNFLLLTYPAYAKNPAFFYDAYNQIMDFKTLKDASVYIKPDDELYDKLNNALETLGPIAEQLFTRENLCFGILYGKTDDLFSMMFQATEEEATALSKDIFKASSEKMNVNDVIYIETLFDSMEDTE